MELTLNETQRQVIDAIDRVVKGAGGNEHGRSVVASSGFDEMVFDDLKEAGFLGLAIEMSPLEATLAVERLAFLGAYVPMGASALVYPMLAGEAANGPVALAAFDENAVVRWGVQASRILIDGGDVAFVLTPQEGDVVSIDNDQTGPALARLTRSARSRAKSLGAGSGDRLRSFWRLAIAAEATGTARGALTLTSTYLIDRIQFGRPLATFQTLQHRLAHLAVLTEGAYWLAMEAAAKPDLPAGAALAATRALAAARLAFRETHQMHGAMGFTREYPLHLWSMKLPSLIQELGGSAGHARAVTSQSWVG